MRLIGRFETVDSLPALYCGDLDALVVADLHLGIEMAESYGGTLMPRFQLGELLEELEDMREETGASVLVVNGDVKHSFSSGGERERREVERFLDRVSAEFEEVWLVKGNHDNALEHRIGDYRNVELEDYFLQEGILFVHGHERLKNLAERGAEVVVIGHEHPALVLRDRIGVKEKVRCFLYGEMRDGREILVMPAFSKLASGTRVNKVPVSRLLSPVLREDVDVDGMRVLAVDREAGLFEFPSLGKLRRR